MDRRRGAPETGFSLVEILITVALLGGVMTVMLGAVSASSRMSDLSLRQAQAETGARRAAEYLRSSAVPFGECGNFMTYYQGYLNGLTMPSGVVSPATVTAVAWGETYTGDTPNWNTTNCVGGTPNFERISVNVVTSGTPSVSVTVTVVKRRLDRG